MSEETAKLHIGDKQVELAVRKGTLGPDVIDVTPLYKETGDFTYDPGFTSTASCESKITFIDGDKGVLLYRGYPIEELAEKGDFIESCYLLLNGELPSEAQKKEFAKIISSHTMLHEQFSRFFHGFRRDSHPMAVMVASLGAMSAFYNDSIDITNERQREIAAFRLISKMPTLRQWPINITLASRLFIPITVSAMRRIF